MESRGNGKNEIGFFSVILVASALIVTTAAQITMSREWVRGKYHGDIDGGKGSDAANAVFPIKIITRYGGPPVSSQDPQSSVFRSAQVLRELLKRIRR